MKMNIQTEWTVCICFVKRTLVKRAEMFRRAGRCARMSLINLGKEE